MATQSSTTAEREAALAMLDKHKLHGERITLGADKAYQHRQFIEQLHSRRIVPHVTEYEPNAQLDNHLTDQEPLRGSVS